MHVGQNYRYKCHQTKFLVPAGDFKSTSPDPDQQKWGTPPPRIVKTIALLRCSFLPEFGYMKYGLVPIASMVTRSICSWALLATMDQNTCDSFLIDKFTTLHYDLQRARSLHCACPGGLLDGSLESNSYTQGL